MEVLTLEWRQVDLDAGTVRLDAHTTKNDSGRVLPYGEVLPDLSDLLQSQRDATKALALLCQILQSGQRKVVCGGNRERA